MAKSSNELCAIEKKKQMQTINGMEESNKKQNQGQSHRRKGIERSREMQVETCGATEAVGRPLIILYDVFTIK